MSLKFVFLLVAIGFTGSVFSQQSSFTLEDPITKQKYQIAKNPCLKKYAGKDVAVFEKFQDAQSVCASYSEVENVYGWQLPSIDLLALIPRSIIIQKGFEYSMTQRFWSSSDFDSKGESSSMIVWAYDFGKNFRYYEFRGNSLYIICVKPI